MTDNKEPDTEPMWSEDVDDFDPPQQQVRWIGDTGSALLPRERMITVADWKAVDVVDMDNARAVHWHSGNDYRVPREEFDFLSQHEFDRFVVADPGFVLEDM